MTPAESGDRFAYPLPFGAEVLADGRTRFRLWAPDHDEIAVCLEPASAGLAMQKEAGGWFGLTTEAAPGTAYRYRLKSGLPVPDPASRAQAEDVHGASLVVDPRDYQWKNHAWAGRRWEDAVICELHVGTATPEGTFEALRRRLDHFVDTGVTAIEIMPVADFSGNYGWGYDGVLLYAPERSYGAPSDLKRLIDEAHGRDLMVLLDVVYNHFGPDGNYLHAYASRFFDETRHTPWGAGIDVGRREVRDFFIHNARYWLEEYRFDGLRFDAVDQIEDGAQEHLLIELARRVREAIPDRHVHLVLENDNNAASLLARAPDDGPRLYTAQWNDDYHHVVHVLLTAEQDGYYCDYAQDTGAKLARALAEGYVYQGEKSAFRDGRRRGEPSAALPSSAFVNFVQNHDQIGNRALGERLTGLIEPRAMEAGLALLLLAPQVPLLFMGEEWGETRPFLYFCDFHDALADAVREGRRNEFRRFERFRSPEARAAIPDPNALSTFEASKLDWSKLAEPTHAKRLQLVKDLLAVRAQEIVPRLPAVRGSAEAAGSLIAARWTLGDGSELAVLANLGPSWQDRAGPVADDPLWAQPALCHLEPTVPPWSVVWTLAPAER
jgi:maltooligosyltrehalose trehalohydrolase